MDNTLRTALAMCEKGFAIHWLWPKSKKPVLDAWNSVSVLTIAELERTYKQGYNVGLRAGKYSVVDGEEIVILDVDIRGGARYADEAYAAANTIMGGTFKPTVMSGSGVGRHQYLGVPKGKSPDIAASTLRQSDIYTQPDGTPCDPRAEDAKPAWMVELLSTGKNVVAPPSIHPDTNKPYTFLEKFL